jgi:DNA-binding NtrC family response regulator
VERDLIQRALMTNAYSLSQTADDLGISRVTLYQKMKKYGIQSGKRTHHQGRR